MIQSSNPFVLASSQNFSVSSLADGLRGSLVFYRRLTHLLTSIYRAGDPESYSGTSEPDRLKAER